MSHQIRVLHVDDDTSFTEVTAAMLEETTDRITVETVPSASDGLDRLADGGIDCVVSDYEMPGRDGIEFLRAVREDHPDLPFILFTGKGSEEIASDAISAGVTDYLQKGTGSEHYELLANRIENAVAGYRSRRLSDERKRRLETLIRNLPGIVYRCRNDPGWPMEAVEGECERLTGYTAGALEAGEVVWGEDVLHPEDREQMWAAVQEALAANEPFEVTYRIVTRDGETRWMWERGRAVHDDGEPATIEGFITDITERREHERDLRETNRQLEAVLDTVSAAIFMKDADGRYLLMNQECREWLGFDPDADIAGLSDEELFPADTAALFRADDRRVTDAGETIQIEEEIVTPDGTREVLTRKSPIYDEDGDLYGICAVATDITDQKAREHDLDAIRERMEFGLDATDTVLWEVDFGDGANTMHGPVERVYGLPEESIPEPEEFIERVVHPEDRPTLETHFRSVLDGTASPFDLEYRTHPENGDVRWLRSEGYPEHDDGDPVRVIGLSTDITDRKERERALERQNDRLDAFADTVSHDLRTPLSVASGHLELAREDCDSDHLDGVARAHDRMEALIEHLLTLAREGDAAADVDTLDLAAVAERSWEGVRTRAGTLAVDTSRTIRADPNQLRQLFENLFRNAVEHGATDPDRVARRDADHASPGPDSRSAHADDGPTDVRVVVGDLADGFYVADDGPGIPEGERDRVFESGYSTAPEGTGVGLGIVQSIAEAHGWEVRVTDSEDGGARFEFVGVETP